MEDYDLTNRTYLVTGASRGIGRAICIKLSKYGANIVLNSRNKTELENTLKLLKNNSNVIITGDITKPEDIKHLEKITPILDGVVFNAGIIKTTPVKYLKKETITELFELNVFSIMLLVKTMLKARKIKNGASICFISSMATEKMHYGNSVYSASKGAINSFAKNLALELAHQKIRVNVILPGLILTPLISKSHITEENLDNHLKNYPLGRFGRPEDVANLAAFLLSDASSWMTGSLIKLDGGYSLK